MLPSSSDLNYFTEVASTLNISRAAERLGISQPSLSLAIKRLEDGLGAPLLMRSKTGVQLTRAGSRFASQAKRLLEDWERLRSETVRDEEVISGRYCIGAHPAVALYSLPNLIAKMSSQYENLEFKLTHALSRQITEDVVSHKVDFGIVVNPVKHPDLVIRLLAKDQVGVWKASGAPNPSDASPSARTLICDPDLLQAQELMKKLLQKGTNFTRQINTSSLELIAALVESGAGYGVVPGRVAKHSVFKPKIELISDSPVFEDEICLIHRVDMHQSSASKRLVKELQGCLRKGL